MVSSGNPFSLMSNRPTLVCLPASLPGAWVRPPEQGGTAADRAQSRRLRQAPEVIDALNIFWSTALGVAWTPVADEQPGYVAGPANSADATESAEPVAIDREEYLRLRHLLYMALFDIYDQQDAQTTAELEFIHDAKSATAQSIGKADFEDALFEISLGWTLGGSAQVHAAFLWDLFSHVANGRPPEVCTWKSEARFAGYRLGEHTSSWGNVSVKEADPKPQRPIVIVPRRSPHMSSEKPKRPKELGAAAWRRVARGGGGSIVRPPAFLPATPR